MSVFKEVGNNRQYRDKYKLHPSKNTQNFETNDYDVDYTFYACDEVDYYEDQLTDGAISLRTIKHLTIKTPSRLNFHPSDKITSFKDNVEWRITKVTVADDNKGKDKSLRPKKVTFLELEG